MADYIRDDDCILYDVNVPAGATNLSFHRRQLLQKAGPRERMYFDPGRVHAGILTCGGLCPGLNDVIRSVVRSLWYSYGVRRISGIRFGFRGLLPDYGLSPLELNPDLVDDIHKVGGTLLGSSRGGGERTAELVDSIERMNLNMLFVVGGDGTQKGAAKIAGEIERRRLKIAVVGIPKTIDNDLSLIQRSFGFETAVSKASQAVSAAHAEAHCAPNGIGLVKLMGRESGFIAVHTALAVNEANFVLIPEVRFDLDGPNGFLEHLKKRLAARNHAVIIVAEGAGRDLLPENGETDASGNRRLGDIAALLRDRITRYFHDLSIEINLKYIDPSYMIRSAPAEAPDAIYCARLGKNAVHAAMAGKTKVLVGLVHDTFVHLPIEAAVAKRSFIDPESDLWRDLTEAVGQAPCMCN